jgi:hypothetical protein
LADQESGKKSDWLIENHGKNLIGCPKTIIKSDWLIKNQEKNLIG